jgi:hypothetical protein
MDDQNCNPDQISALLGLFGSAGPCAPCAAPQTCQPDPLLGGQFCQ